MDAHTPRHAWVEFRRWSGDWRRSFGKTKPGGPGNWGEGTGAGGAGSRAVGATDKSDKVFIKARQAAKGIGPPSQAADDRLFPLPPPTLVDVASFLLDQSHGDRLPERRVCKGHSGCLVFIVNFLCQPLTAIGLYLRLYT